MSKMEYMPVDCLQVPKMLFQVEEFKNLSNTCLLYTSGSIFMSSSMEQDRMMGGIRNGNLQE